MAAPPTVNTITSNTTTDLSSEPPSKTSASGVTNTGCEVSSCGTPVTQDSSCSLMKKVSKTKLMSEVCE